MAANEDKDAGDVALAQHRAAAKVAFDPGYGSSNSEYTLQTGAHGLSWNPGDGMVKGATGQDPLQSGLRPFTAQSVSVGTSSSDGLVNYNVEMELKQGLRVEGEGSAGRIGQVGLSAETFEGVRGRYQVSLPNGGDAGDAMQVNPFNPLTIPIGGRVTLDGQAFKGSAMEGTFRNIAMQTELTEAAGASYRVDRVDASHVRVSMGPNQALSAFNGIGVETSALTAIAGRQDALGHSKVKTAVFDLASADGQAAYQHFVGTGELAAQTPGVQDVATVERLGASSQTRLKVGVGDVASMDLAGARNAGEIVRTTFDDGRYTEALRAEYSGNVPMTRIRQFDVEGNEDVSARRYEFRIDTRDHEHGREISSMLNSVLTGERGEHRQGPIRPGDDATLVFSEAQMRQLMQQTQRAVEGQPSPSPWLRLMAEDGRGTPQQDVDAFALSLARMQGQSTYGFAERLSTVSRLAADDPRQGLAPVSATVESDRLRDLPPPSPLRPQDPRHADNVDHPLLLQSHAAVRALDQRMGRLPDADSERLGTGLMIAAKREQLTEINHALIGNDGRRAFAVQGDPASADKRVASVVTAEALATPVAAQARAIEAQPTLQRTEPALAPQNPVQEEAVSRGMAR